MAKREWCVVLNTGWWSLETVKVWGPYQTRIRATQVARELREHPSWRDVRKYRNGTLKVLELLSLELKGDPSVV